MFDTLLITKALKKLGISKVLEPGAVSGAVLDSRQAKKGSIFFAFKGEKLDGHDFVPALLQKGVYCVGEKGDHEHERFIKVPDVLKFMHELAYERRKVFKGKVIALTGSSGKTTTRELLSTLLSLSGKSVYSSSGNLNNHLGVPLVILNLPMNIDYMVLEMGMNHSGEMKLLAKTADPDISFITNIGTAHIGNFHSQKELADAKLELFDHSSSMVIADIDDKYIANWTENNGQRNIISYRHGDFTEKYEAFSDQPTYMVDNLLTAAEVVKNVLGKVPDLKKVLKKFTIPEMRGEVKVVGKRKFIVDCYNANPDSMSRSIAEFYKKSVEEDDQNIYLILGSMFELGEFSKKMHQELVNYLKTLKLLKRAFLIGCEFEKTRESFLNEKNIFFLGKVGDVIPLLPEGGVFLMKGSRSNGLEKIFDFLEG